MGNSMGFDPDPLPDMDSFLQPTSVIPSNSPENSASKPPLVHPPPTLSPLEDTSIHWEKPPNQPHSCSNCDYCAKFQDGLAILQDLVFVICKDVADIWFCLEIMDKKGMQILQMLSTLQGP